MNHRSSDTADQPAPLWRVRPTPYDYVVSCGLPQSSGWIELRYSPRSGRATLENDSARFCVPGRLFRRKARAEWFKPDEYSEAMLQMERQARHALMTWLDDQQHAQERREQNRRQERLDWADAVLSGLPDTALSRVEPAADADRGLSVATNR